MGQKIKKLQGPTFSPGYPGTGKGSTREQKQAALRAQLPDSVGAMVRRPGRFLSNLRRGHGPAIRKLTYLKAAGDLLGYGKPADEVQKHYEDALAAGTPVDLHHEERPTYDLASGQVRSALTQGAATGHYLTPEQEAAMRGSQREAVEAGTADAYRSEASRGAAAGIDPRSGLANQRNLMVQRARLADLTGVERNVTQANADRRTQLESQAAGYAGLEEGARGFDTGAEQRRLAGVEGGLSDIAKLRENQFQFGASYTEAQRQAERTRQANAKAAKELEPSTLEKVAGGVGGFLKGATGS